MRLRCDGHSSLKSLVLGVMFVLMGTACGHPSVKTATDRFTPALEHPTKFDQLEFASRYWAFDKYLIHFISNVNEQNKNQTPVIYVHGLAGSLEGFSEVIKVLHAGPRPRPFYALDLPGFGKSYSRGAELSIRRYAEMLQEFVLRLGVPKVILVCHSMGGQVCIDYALANPERIQLLTLISPAGVYQKSAYIQQTLHHYVGISLGRVDHPGADSFGDMSWLNQSFVRKMGANNANVLMAIESYRDNFHERIQKLKTKTLILWGREDKVFSFENGLYLKENIENSTLYILDGADHFSMKNQGAAVSKLILKYL